MDSNVIIASFVRIDRRYSIGNDQITTVTAGETDHTKRKNGSVVRFGEPFGEYLYLIVGVCCNVSLWLTVERNTFTFQPS